MNYGGICLASTPVLFLISVDIRREERKRAFIRLFTYQLTVSYLQKCSFVFLMYFMIRRLHKNEQNLENRGCVENGCVTSDVRTVLGFVHVTGHAQWRADILFLTWREKIIEIMMYLHQITRKLKLSMCITDFK